MSHTETHTTHTHTHHVHTAACSHESDLPSPDVLRTMPPGPPNPLYVDYEYPSPAVGHRPDVLYETFPSEAPKARRSQNDFKRILEESDVHDDNLKRLKTLNPMFDFMEEFYMPHEHVLDAPEPFFSWKWRRQCMCGATRYQAEDIKHRREKALSAQTSPIPSWPGPESSENTNKLPSNPTSKNAQWPGMTEYFHRYCLRHEISNMGEEEKEVPKNNLERRKFFLKYGYQYKDEC